MLEISNYLPYMFMALVLHRLYLFVVKHIKTHVTSINQNWPCPINVTAKVLFFRPALKFNISAARSGLQICTQSLLYLIATFCRINRALATCDHLFNHINELRWCVCVSIPAIEKEHKIHNKTHYST